mmetsp:Transcript_6370/g.12108  ORF Transcript_6370/g.12108 Transcript_6370/m.12108 type:complete len:413 (+) Transcript_6370:57-1295(+)|eukprot:CAMPEP_0114272940 /NCGR_PEP_ID=MMETSP0058-20121206/28795_1 /TAXON_ID=36894 /ORGANISM="Pyramimonas parkeae, CCMP726" /LENGTH=412 /DNA_ID=CAMNT_0001392289 /DNA_START=18 /DNA_END=1256 /DNA_ORIENTATION=+
MAEPDEAQLKAQFTAINELVQACKTRGSLVADSMDVLGDLLDGLILDVALDAHRMAHLGIPQDDNSDDEELDSPLPSVAVMESWGQKNKKDIFGQTHPQIASDFIPCANCKRPIMAGRFAPHLEKCLGKGRNSSRQAKRPTSYLEPTMANLGVQQRSPPKRKHSKALHVDAQSRGSRQHPTLASGSLSNPSLSPASLYGEEEQLEALDGSYLEGDLDDDPGSKKKKQDSSSKGQLRRKVRSLLADRVKFLDLRSYLGARPGAACSSAAFAAIKQAANTFKRLAGGAGGSQNTNRLKDVQCVLENVCCVVSQRECTKDKICANSANCPIHTVAQRAEMRRELFDAGVPGGPVKKLKKKLVIAHRPAYNSASTAGGSGPPLHELEDDLSTMLPGEDLLSLNGDDEMVLHDMLSF